MSRAHILIFLFSTVCIFDGNFSSFLVRIYCKHLHKMIYMENRSFLPNNHPLRNDVQSFPCRAGQNKVCKSAKPATPSYKELVDKHAIYDRAKSQTERAFLAKSYGCKGKYTFMRLPNHDRTTLVHPDAMHTITNVITTLVGLLSGNANISQVLHEEEEFGRREWCRDMETGKGTDFQFFVGFLIEVKGDFNFMTICLH